MREWLKDLAEPDRRAIGRDLMRAQWPLASGHASMPFIGAGALGNTYRSAERPDCSRLRLPERRCPGRPAWLHQEDAENAGP